MATPAVSCSESVNTTGETTTRTEEVSASVKTPENGLMLEYETQFFGFTPKSFSDGMYNAVLEFTWDCLDGARQYIIHKFPEVVSKENADQAAEDIMDKLTAAIDKAFDKFEAYILTNVFIIPRPVVLPEDAVHQGACYTEEDETSIDQEIQQLEDKIKAAKYVNACLCEEVSDIGRVQAAYDELLTLQRRMEKLCAECGVPDLREALVYNSEKAKRIQKILNRTRDLSSHPVKLSL